jgi:predicted kinase
MLIILSGLPGTGKTMIAKELARQLDGVYLRIDSIEQAIRNSEIIEKGLYDAGYRVGYAVAQDNLFLGRRVIADSVNPIALTRDAWLAVAHRAQAPAVEIEVKCSDEKEHRKRVETRRTDVAGLKLPSWEEVVSRDYQPWAREHIIIDTAGRSVEQCVQIVLRQLERGL